MTEYGVLFMTEIKGNMPDDTRVEIALRILDDALAKEGITDYVVNKAVYKFRLADDVGLGEGRSDLNRGIFTIEILDKEGGQ